MKAKLEKLEKRASRASIRAFIVLDGDGEPTPETLVTFTARGERRELPLAEFERLYEHRRYELSIIRIVERAMVESAV